MGVMVRGSYTFGHVMHFLNIYIFLDILKKYFYIKDALCLIFKLDILLDVLFQF